MKKSRKRPLIVLSIIALVLLAAGAVLFFLLPNMIGEAGISGQLFFNLLKESYLSSFTKTEAKIPNLYATYGAEQAMFIGVLQMILTVVMVVFFLFGLIFVCAMKRPKLIPVQFLALVAGFVGALAVAGGVLLLHKFTDTPNASWAPMVIVWLVCTIFGFIVAFVTVLLSWVFAIATRADKKEEAKRQAEEEARKAEEEAEAQRKAEQEAEERRAFEEEARRKAEAEAQAREPKAEEKPQDLAAMLRDLVREIVKDELARQPQPQQQPYNGPLVVQYFGSMPVQAPVEEKQQPEPQPEPVKEEEPQPEPVAEPEPEPIPEPVPAPVVEAQPEAKQYERLTFTERLLQSEDDVLNLYNEVKNEILSWGVKSRISANGDTFRLHKKMYVRITVAGKALKLYFALDPKDYENTTIPVQDASHKDMYQEIPLVFKVKSGLSLRRCKDLIQDVMEKDGLEQGEVGKVNWVNELKAQAAEAAKDED